MTALPEGYPDWFIGHCPACHSPMSGPCGVCISRDREARRERDCCSGGTCLFHEEEADAAMEAGVLMATHSDDHGEVSA